MPDGYKPTNDDRLTIISISALACILQDVLHEGLGHGVTAWLSGAHKVTMSTVAMQSDIETRWISANGTLVNLLFAAIFWLLLLKPQRYSPAVRYFLVLTLAGNLFTGTGYFFFSGVANFGDWAAVIHGLEPYWMWRLGLVVLGVVMYFASMLQVGAQLLPFRGAESRSSRLRALCWIPYFTNGVLAGVSGALNPMGLFYVIASALPSTLGANAGLLSLPSMMRNWRFKGSTQVQAGRVSDAEPAEQAERVAPIRRSVAWIATGAIASLLFIFVLGRGVTWSR
jgi:hypothetical protein